MTRDDRPLLPRIHRAWDPQQGRMVWACNDLPPGRWGLGVSQQARYDWRQAQMWCHRQNAAAKAEGRP